MNEYVLKYVLNGQRERFDGEMTESQMTLLYTLSVLISLFAAWVSWQRNSQYSIAYKIVFALFAYMFGIIYLIAVAFFKLP